MKKNKPKNKDQIIYSTNPNFIYDDDNISKKRIDNKKQILYIHVEKHKGGKSTVIIKNLAGEESDLRDLAKIIKNKCGVGGSVKNREIIIQGNKRDRVIEILEEKGYQCRRSGG